ncbi:HtaA domain-containing protein [Rhodococcus sp. IEGM 1370]|uniref:HtaA domain-containing protein n=1 Tax=Rhodococcus sp. IEGM 1370 TaxID=3082222 RepID=UPI0029540999|nr:HtaA domain-containing protein [Rhodococcus sp. IEGM 1370]MDV8079569.1 HtaA domain-containing protein [Rhodococcus sp. IEGM 1370]
MSPDPHDLPLPQVGLTWGIRRSFIRYISGLPDGAHATFDGAYLGDGSYFTFPGADRTADRHSELAFCGIVRIAGHGGMLDVLIADPGIEHNSGDPVLTIVDPAHWPKRNHRLVLARLTPMDDAASTTGSSSERRWSAVLTEPGSAVFGGNYPSGTDLDPVIVR